MNKEKLFTEQELIQDLKKAGIPEGCLLHLKVSLKAIGKIDGGPKTLLNALIKTVGSSGTLVIDSFTTSYPLPLSEEHATQISTKESPSYAGALANVMIQHPDSVRSNHPIQRFTAIGAMAEELMNAHTPESGGYDVLERMAELNAMNLSVGRNTVGVGTTHVAIEKMGFGKKRSSMGVNYLKNDGSVGLFEVNWNGGCGRGFPKFLPYYEKENHLKWVKVGKADAVYTSMKGTLNVELAMVKKDPSFYFCDDPTCKDCRLNWDHSTGNIWRVKYYSMLSILKNKFK